MSSVIPEEKPTSGVPPRPGRRFDRCGCWIVVIAGVVLVLGFFGIRAFVAYTFGPERMARFKEYDRRILDIPERWQEPVPIPSAEVVDFHFKFYDDMERVGSRFGALNEGYTTQTVFYRMRHGEALTASEQQEVDQLVAALRPIIAETSSSIELPLYTADTSLYSSGPQFLPVHYFAKLSSIVAIDTARRGDCRAAIDIAALPMRYFRHEKPANLMLVIMEMACSGISLGTFQAVAEECDDGETLRYGLNLLEQLREHVEPLSQEEVRLTDAMSELNRAKAFGYPVNLGPQTASNLTLQVSGIYGQPYAEWAVRHFPEDDRRHEYGKNVLAKMSEHKEPTSLWANQQRLAPRLGSALFGVSPGAILTDIAIPNYDEARIRSKVLLANYELVRLHVAQRLNEMESAPRSGVDVISALPEVPADPFSSGTLLLRPDTNRFYSVGPDETDDGGAVIYDATNGTISSGDILLPRRVR